MLFVPSQSQDGKPNHKIANRRRPQNWALRHKLQRMIHAHHVDTAVQTSTTDLDPTQWTGNQRITHYGPMAQRDPFFYYYPKGWDVLYPAHFGFFPYRTSKFRGSSPTICLTAFGFFLLLSGLCMCIFGFILGGPQNYLWHVTNDISKIGSVPPVQLAGPIFVIMGVLCLLLGCLWWASSLNLCSEHLRHRQPHRNPPKRTLHVPPPPRVPRGWSNQLNKSPYQPPPPYPVIENAHTNVSNYNPESEMKLFPPIMPGYSTLSLPRTYVGSPYNTLNADNHRRQSFVSSHANSHARTSRSTMPRGSIYPHNQQQEVDDSNADSNDFHWMEYHAAKMPDFPN